MANKKKFYTMHIGNKRNKYTLVEHKGYEDSEFLYYGSNGIWYAIDPTSGAAVISAGSSKEVRNLVHKPSIQKKFAKFKQTQRYQEYAQAYKELKKGLKR